MSFDLKDFKWLAENRTQKPLDYTGFAKDAEFLSYCWNNADAIIKRIELAEAKIEKLERALECVDEMHKSPPLSEFNHWSKRFKELRKELERGE